MGSVRKGYDKGRGLGAVYGGGMIKGEVCGQCEEGYDKGRSLWAV